MVDTQRQVNPPLLENILAQPDALESVAAHHGGDGRAAMLQSAEILLSKKRIVLTGMGASLFACIPLHYMLASHGLEVAVIETAELLHFLTPTLNADTSIVLVSRSGQSVESLKLLNRIGGQGCATIGIVNEPGSDLAARVDRAIVIGSPADQLVAIQTYTGTLVTLALLGAACLGGYDDAVSELEGVYAPLAQYISRCQETSRDWFDAGSRQTPVYLLGRGAALASVQAGVLLMHEVAKTAAVGMSAAQFRHGPVETVGADFRAVIIGTQHATAQMDLQLAQDLSRMGGEIRWLGPLPRSSEMAVLSEWPETIPDRFASVFETVPLQLLAFRMAERNGMAPGEFRWASTVTTSEMGFAGLSGS